MADDIESIRSQMYLALVLMFLKEPNALRGGKDLGLDLSDCDTNSLKASNLRVDLDPVTRGLIRGAIREFYDNYGYITMSDPDSLVTMLAFMAQLSKRRDREALLAQIRFLNVHLIPLIKKAIELGICPQLKEVLRLIEEDVEILKSMLDNTSTD